MQIEGTSCTANQKRKHQRSRTDGELRNRPGPTNPQPQKRQNPLDGGFKLCGEVTTLNRLQCFLRTALMISSFFCCIFHTVAKIISDR
ncbi:hypothetical protein FAD52_19840 [Escherichia coli]|nr:hypothetical protein [Escherichia coli]